VLSRPPAPRDRRAPRPADGRARVACCLFAVGCPLSAMPRSAAAGRRRTGVAAQVSGSPTALGAHRCGQARAAHELHRIAHVLHTHARTHACGRRAAAPPVLDPMCAAECDRRVTSKSRSPMAARTLRAVVAAPRAAVAATIERSVVWARLGRAAAPCSAGQAKSGTAGPCGCYRGIAGASPTSGPKSR
jgi:hypothetical protein